MNPILGVTLIGALALAGAAWWWWQRREALGDDPDEAPNPRDKRDKRVEFLDTVTGWMPEPTRVLNHAERKAHALLVRAVPECMILAQVPIARFIRVPTRNSYHEWMRRVGQLCADLVVCDDGAQVLAVVEVRRDSASATERSRKRHERMDRVLREAGVRVLVWGESSLPHPEAVRDLLLTTPKGLHSEQGGATVRTRGSAARGLPKGNAPVASAEPGPRARLEDVLDEIDRNSVLPASAVADPPTSTWMDELDSSPTPLSPRADQPKAAPRLR